MLIKLKIKSATERDDYVVHTLRHTFSTMGVELGHDGHHVDECLNHNQGGIRMRYQHSKNFAAQKKVFESIQHRLLEIEQGVDLLDRNAKVLKMFG